MHLPYLSEFCLFVAGFLAAFVYGDSITQRFQPKRLVASWRRRRRR
jgi:hypothetical protein